MSSTGPKVYTLTPKFITKIGKWIRKVRLGIYKKQKVNQSKTPHKRMYHMTFKIHLTDEVNPQVSSVDYQMVVPARAAFFAKISLEEVVKEKIAVEVVKWEEMTEEEHEEFLSSKEKFIKEKNITTED